MINVISNFWILLTANVGMISSSILNYKMNKAAMLFGAARANANNTYNFINKTDKNDKTDNNNGILQTKTNRVRRGMKMKNGQKDKAKIEIEELEKEDKI